MAQNFRRTAFATAAFSLAERFNLRFISAVFDSGTPTLPNPNRIDMVAPEGESTGGGTQAVQHIRLVPERGPAIVIGSANQKEKTAELRTHALLAQQFARRFANEALPMSAEIYQPLMQKIEAFLVGEKLTVTTADAAQTSPSPEAPKASGVNPIIVVTLVTALVVALIAVVLLMRR